MIDMGRGCVDDLKESSDKLKVVIHKVKSW